MWYVYDRLTDKSQPNWSRQNLELDEIKNVIDLYMLFLWIYNVMLAQTGYYGLKYIVALKRKPVYNLDFYLSDNLEKETKEMEVEFDDWNIKVKNILESYFRS